MTRILVAGESWVSQTTHYKGFDSFTSVTFHTGIEPFANALTSRGLIVDHLPAHEVPERFPRTAEELSAWDVVILSDIGANSLLLHPDTWQGGHRTPNRPVALAEWVRGGGGLAMAGGYLSFQGFEGKAFFHGTPVEDVLPCVISSYDDRVEVPDGVEPKTVDDAHVIVSGVRGPWPALLGYNRFGLKDDAVLLAEINSDPLLAVRQVGRGRTLAWASDIAPHWCTQDFMDWDGYPVLFANACRWLAGSE